MRRSLPPPPATEAELIRSVLSSFLSRARRLPRRPTRFTRSIVIVRKDIVPFYHAIYDHVRGRFTELQVPRPGSNNTLIIPIPGDQQPPDLGCMPGA
ncbi:MAG: hypothetical protein QM724_12255 [Flavobacteriales bacterium]